MTEHPVASGLFRFQLRVSWWAAILAALIGLDARSLRAQESPGRVVLTATTKIKVPQSRYVSHIRYAPDGASFAAASNGNPIGLLDAQTLAERARFEGHLGIIYELAFLPDGKTLVSAGRDGTVRFWDLATRRERLRLDDFQGSVFALAVSPDGSRIFAGESTKDAKGEIRCWDPGTGKAIRAIPNYNAGAISMSVSPDGSTLATVARDHFVHFWATADFAERYRFDSKELHVFRMSYGDEGRLLAMVFSDRSIRVFETAPLRLKYQIDPAAAPTLSISPDSAFLVTTGGDEFQLRDFKTGTPVTPRIDFGERVSAVSFAPDSKHLIVGGGLGTIQAYRLDRP